MDPIEPAYGTATLLLIAAAAVALLLLLILRFRLHAFVALVLVSLLTALVTRIPFADVVPTLLQRLRQHARDRGAARRLRRDDRPDARDHRRRAGAGRPAGRRLRRAPRAAGARHRLAAVRLPDLLRRRPRRDAADHLQRGAPLRRLGADLRAAGGRRLRGDARLPAAASRARSPPATCSAPTSACWSSSASLVAMPTWYLGSYLFGLWIGKRFVLPVPRAARRRSTPRARHDRRRRSARSCWCCCCRSC